MYENHWAILDGAAFQDKKKAHEIISRELSFPSYYGENLDALYDCLTEMGQTEIDLFSCALIRRNLDAYGPNRENIRAAVEKIVGRSAFRGTADETVFCGRWDTRL